MSDDPTPQGVEPLHLTGPLEIRRVIGGWIVKYKLEYRTTAPREFERAFVRQEDLLTFIKENYDRL